MKISTEFPPNIEDIIKTLAPPPTAVFTHGDTVYNPSNGALDIPIVAHEEMHSKQQGDDPAGWWVKYLADPIFRIEQEVAAYQIQYYVQCKLVKKRDERALNLQRLAQTLSGGMYGCTMSLAEAKRLIQIVWKKKK